LGILWATTLTAQTPVEHATEKVRIDGVVYYVHVVKKSETLYSLSKAYNVALEQIVQANPGLTDGLKAGRTVRIPVTDAAPAPSLPTTGTLPPPTDTATRRPAATRPLYHIVKPSETLWSIAEQYGVTTDELRRLNPDAFHNDVLMRDALLSIPQATPDEAPEPAPRQTAYLMPQEAPDEMIAPLERPANVALILPLLAPDAPTTTDTTISAAEQAERLLANQKKVENYHAFYQGALLAVEDLKQQGLSLRLSVYDCHEETKLDELLLNDELRASDMIIGPVHAHQLKPVADYARDRQIKIVSPLDPTAESLAVDHPTFFQVSPPADCRRKKLIDTLLAQTNTHIIVIAEASGHDSLLLANYRELLGARWSEVTLYSHTAVRGTALRDSLALRLRPDKTNCVLVASNQEATVSDVAANLYLLTLRQRYSIVLFGTERWRTFETIDLTYFHALNLHMVVPFFVDYEKEPVRNFVARFQQTYKADPSQYAFQGYDTFYYFLQALWRYGTRFEQHLQRYQPPLLQTRYAFRRYGNDAGGLVNIESCLIRYTPAYAIEQR
jgi:LysM repeat protein/ABC-type branched-subunit amino acid transport system substrate-binding protein